MKLGEVSATGDAEGDIKAVSNRQPTRQEVQTTLQSFVGEDMQTPPAYSALKINGQPAYKLVRAGQDVVLDPRPVTIHSINVTKYDYPFVEFTTEVSSGTYIRSLVSDAGDKLGTGAYMSGLRRTEVGSFRLNNACLVADTSIAKLIQA